MSAEIINLRRVRKDKRRADKAAAGATNRAMHGRTRSEREGETVERARAARELDGHHLRGSNDDGDAS